MGRRSVGGYLKLLDYEMAGARLLTPDHIKEAAAGVGDNKELAATGKTLKEVGKMYGMSKQSVSNYLSILNYESMVAHTLTSEHIKHAEAGTKGNRNEF